MADNLVNQVITTIKEKVADSSPTELGIGGALLAYVLSTSDKERNAVISGVISYVGADQIKSLIAGKSNGSK